MCNVVKQGSFKIDVFNVKVNIIVLETSQDVNAKVKELSKKHKTHHLDETAYAGYVLSFDLNTYYLLLSKNHLTINTVTHETDHLRNFILGFNSIVENEARETSANLNGYINQMVFKFFKKNNIEIK